MKAAQKPCIFLENAVCLLVLNETDNGACLTVTRFPQGHIAQKFRDLTKRSLFCVRSSFEPQAHDSLGISALSGSWESRLVLLDGDDAGRVRRDALLKELYAGNDQAVLMLSDVLGVSECETEDIL